MWNPYGQQQMQPNVSPSNMAYPYTNMPYMDRMAQMNQMAQQIQNSTMMPQQMQNTGLVRVTGIDGARAYQMPPNSVSALFDDTQDVFYIKSTDSGGFGTIKGYQFVPIEPPSPTPVAMQMPTNDFVTRQEFQKQFDELKGMIDNGKQSVSEQPTNNAKQQSSSNIK